ncbi:MAG: lysophospholipid acyltransferase family protein [Deltaproteobacteria bacterium]|nr:lysophospholipid acyltransferase family protein [Deltaproteobacteria bacterium]
MKRKLSFWLRIAIWIIPWLLRVINITIRFKIKGIENRPQDKNRIYALFHGQQAYFYGANDEEGIVVLTSRSRDGEILSQILIRLGFQVVRGSSSRGGTSGLLSLIKKAKKGHPVLIAVDGPKGPYHHVKEGIILLAQATGLPIIPLAASGSKKITIKSWDKTHIPLPFSKVVIMIGKPIYIASDLEKDKIEYYRKKLEKEMITLTNKAEHSFISSDS